MIARLRPRTSSFARNDIRVLVKPLTDGSISYFQMVIPTDSLPTNCHLDRPKEVERSLPGKTPEISRLRPRSASFARNDAGVVCEGKIDD